MFEDGIRVDWMAAFETLPVYKISEKIGWGITNQDLIVFGFLHKNDIHRKEIEALLEDCNFHEERSLLRNDKYNEYENLIKKDFKIIQNNA